MLIAQYYNITAAEKAQHNAVAKLVLESRHDGETLTDNAIYVTGKRQARTIAVANGYKPWNF